MTPSPKTPAATWAAEPERGSRFFVTLGLRLVLGLGWRFGRVLLLGISGWFLATSPAARAASRDYLGRVLGRPARLADVARHIHAFAGSILDAPFLLTGRSAGFQVTVAGTEHLDRAVASGRGCMLLGSHLGSFEVLRQVGEHAPAPVRPMMFRRNAGVLSGLLDQLDPELCGKIIEIGHPESLLAAREALERGEIIAILADRDPYGGRMVPVDFLGAPAPFPVGPLLLAASLRAPIVLFRAVCTGPRRYEVFFEPFADRLVLRREQRQRDLHAAVTRFAAFVEAGCRAHPYEWFNFYPFWKGLPDVPAAEPVAPADLRAGLDGAGTPPPGRRAA